MEDSDLDHQAFDLVLERADLSHEIGSLVGSDAAADDCPRYTTSATEGHLGWNIHVWSVLVLAKKWKMEQNSQRGLQKIVRKERHHATV